uniref:Disease resistance R13L4/SHOC-2-like LRR domain-containing protein n=1 Tax=Cyclophora tenuis TaxID=216820 RepID=A0A7S1GJ93_CYCTE
MSNPTSLQGKAFKWILSQDLICPDYPMLVQRFALVVLYYSTNGDSWRQCSNNPSAMDRCGEEKPFMGATRFLTTSSSECDWAGITCDGSVVTTLLFERNNLGGSIPTEIGLLTGLREIGMEQGRLSGSIPSELGRLSQLYFIDLDYNELVGSLPSELWSLTLLQQLDLNNNRLSGTLSTEIGSLTKLQFLQLNSNPMVGTIPSQMGLLTDLKAFTLHDASFSGSMPTEICAVSSLQLLVADCYDPETDIVCLCCNNCWSEH